MTPKPLAAAPAADLAMLPGRIPGWRWRKLAGLLWMALAAAVQAAPAATHPFAVTDPVLQMPAWTLALPDGWTAEGTMLPGSSCATATTPTFRAASGDGSVGFSLLPRIDWAWGAAVNAGSDCLAVREAISAHDFLTYFIRSRGLGFVREEPVPELAEMRRNMEALNQQSAGQRHTTADAARYEVGYTVDGQPVQEWVTASVICADATLARLGHQFSCSAFVSRWFAPAGRLAALLPTFQAMKMTVNPLWMERWTAVMVSRTQARSQQQTEALLQQGRLAQAARTRDHQGFMASMQRGRDLRNDQFNARMAQRQRGSDDFVDYVLDCQRAYGRQGRVSVGNCPNRQTY